jgi:hypothetical protein
VVYLDKYDEYKERLTKIEKSEENNEVLFREIEGLLLAGKEEERYERILEHFGITAEANKDILISREPLKALYVLQYQSTKKKFKLIFHYDPDFPYAVTERFTN